MDVGINLPWIGYGWDFGGPSHYGRSEPNWRTDLINHLRDFRAAGISVVRWFILGDGFVLGTHGAAPRERNGQWKFDSCPSLHSAALADWVRALEIFRDADVKLIPSIIDFKAAQPGIQSSSASGYVKQGRADLFSPRQTREFVTRVLGPMLDAADPFHDQIYAWEFVNEPEWIVQNASSISVADIRNFIYKCYDKISRRSYRSTVGFVRESTLFDWAPFDRVGAGNWPHTHIRPSPQRRRVRRLTTQITIPADFIPQFHYYTHSRSRPIPATLPTPLILGEFATRPGFDVWPGLSGDQGTNERLVHLQRAGVTLALPWSYPNFNTDGPTSRSWPELRGQIASFTGASH